MKRKSGYVLVLGLSLAFVSELKAQSITWAQGYPTTGLGQAIYFKGSYDLGTYQIEKNFAEVILLPKNGGVEAKEHTIPLTFDQNNPKTKGTFGNPNPVGPSNLPKITYTVTIRILARDPMTGVQVYVYGLYKELTVQ